MWQVCHRHGYVTPADFLRGRYGSGGLALVIAFTGVLATMPYIALQLVGIQVVLNAMGISGDWPLVLAFGILAAYTYQSGLRAPALIALVKDTLIYVTILVAVIYIPWKLGVGHIFDSAASTLPHKTTATGKPGAFLPGTPAAQQAYASLALGSALALFLYPHSITGVLSARSADVVRRNAVFLPAYTLLLGLIAVLGYMAIAAGVSVKNPNFAVPDLFIHYFPAWFEGFAFAAIAIGALVPAAVMSIAAANLFSRNVWKEYVRPQATGREETHVARIVSLLVKVGALLFVIFLPTKYAIDLQLLGGVWILQTLPAIIVGLFTRWFHRLALFGGWAAGMAVGTWMATTSDFKTSVYALNFAGIHFSAYEAVFALITNLVVTIVLTVVLRAFGLRDRADETQPDDYYELREERARPPEPELAG
jgi:SSS family solute:Na+ symporter